MSWIKRALQFSRRVRIVAGGVPAKWWFRSSLLLSSLQGRAANALGRNGRLTELVMRDHWLRELTCHGPFPVAQRVHGKKELDRYAGNGPVIYCSTHLAGFEVCLRALIEMGESPVAVADDGRIAQGRYSFIGLQATLPTLRATPYTLTQMRSLLVEGQSIACMADKEYLDPDLSSNCLRLAGRLRVPVIFTWAKLGADGVFDVMFQPAPHPYCENEAAIEENLDFLRGLHGSIRASLGLTPQNAVVVQPYEIPIALNPRHSEAA